jgi:hypothetical protein
MNNYISVEEILKWPEMDDVRQELEDPTYANRRHGSRATYALGCHGPLCRKKERMRGRNRNETTASRLGKDYEPSPRRIYDRDAVLDAISNWHAQELALRRINVRVGEVQ